MKVIYEDRDILVCFKPAGVATQTASFGEPDMVSLVKNYLAKQRGEKNPYLGLVHRLDQPVSGILVFGKNKKASTVWMKEKEYYALCLGVPVDKEGMLKHYLWKNPASKKAEVSREKPLQNKEAKEAILSYEVEKEGQEVSLVKIKLDTGRFHQIRAQFSAIGNPLLGDRKYGSEESIALSKEKGIKTIALCAWHLKFIHPVTKKEMEFYLGKENLPSWISL